MGILLIAGQLRTNRQIFTPTSSLFYVLKAVGCLKARRQEPRPDHSPVVTLDASFLPMLGTKYNRFCLNWDSCSSVTWDVSRCY